MRWFELQPTRAGPEYQLICLGSPQWADYLDPVAKGFLRLQRRGNAIVLQAIQSLWAVVFRPEQPRRP